MNKQDEKAKVTAIKDGVLNILFLAVGQLVSYLITLLPFLNTFEDGKYAWAQGLLGLLLGTALKSLDRYRHEDSSSSTGLVKI